MALTVEQASLLKAVNERIGEVQTAIKRAMPGNPQLHEEFGVGKPLPETPAAAIELAKRIEPLAREYKSLLLSRGVDAAKVSHLSQLTTTLEHAAPAPEPEPEPKKAKK